MAKRKINIDVIEGLSQVPDDKLVVQKSNPLMSLAQTDLTLAEFKILDTYLSRINTHDPDKRTVRFEKGELEELLGVDRIRKEVLEQRLKNLFRGVEVQDDNEVDGFKIVALFDVAEAKRDNDGFWQVNLQCSENAMKYIFNVDNLGYLRYKLRTVTSISSRYSYIMFLYLESNRYRKSWKVDLDELKKILNCDQEETYKEYKHFNNLVLKRVQKELTSKTECNFSYEPVKKRRMVVAIKFTIDPITELETTMDHIDGLMDDFFFEGHELFTNRDRWTRSWCIMFDRQFTFTEMREFVVLADELPLAAMYPDNRELEHEMRIDEYFREKKAAMESASKRKPIKNKYAYFKRMIQQDINEWRRGL